MRFFKQSTKLAIQSHYASLQLTIKEQTNNFLKFAAKITGISSLAENYLYPS